MRSRIYHHLIYILLVFVCVILILYMHRYLDNVSLINECKTFKSFSRSDITNINTKTSLNLTETILENTRLMIKLETWDYNFTHSGVNDIEDLVMESGGTPVRSVIVTTWRSGSSFLGELLNAMPANFYNYEPLMIYYAIQIRGLPYAMNATSIIKDMLKCNFMQAWNGMTEYFAHVKKIKKVVNQIELNRRLWSKCSYKEELLCYNATLVSKFCTLFPFQSMKLVRLRLPAAKPLLEDKELNVKVVVLVRDPRAVMQSRRNFCKTAECSNPIIVCLDMIADYRAAIELIQSYPDKLMVLRYEDLISDLNATTSQLLQFLRLGRTPSIDEFLQTHTNIHDVKPFSTFRVSRDIPFKWMKSMNFSDVENIQMACAEAMSLWGYESAHNASHMASESLYPVRPSWKISLPAMDQPLQ